MAHILYTAGYTGIKPAHLKATSQRLGAMVVDIRMSPYSRHEQWNQDALQKLLGGRYTHIQELGNVNYAQTEQGIKLKNADEGTIQAALLLRNFPLIFLCACAEWEHCHRLVAAEEMEMRYGVEVVHLAKHELMGLPPPSEQLVMF